jgi:hypothetical protein
MPLNNMEYFGNIGIEMEQLSNSMIITAQICGRPEICTCKPGSVCGTGGHCIIYKLVGMAIIIAWLIYRKKYME